MIYEFEFNATTGVAPQPVVGVLTYEIDEDGVFAENVEDVFFEGVNVGGLLSMEQIQELEALGIKELHKFRQEELDRAMEP